MRLFSGKYSNLIAVMFFFAAVKSILVTAGVRDTLECYYASPEGSPIYGMYHGENNYLCLEKTKLPLIPSIEEISGIVRGLSGI